MNIDKENIRLYHAIKDNKGTLFKYGYNGESTKTKRPFRTRGKFEYAKMIDDKAKILVKKKLNCSSTMASLSSNIMPAKKTFNRLNQ